MKQQQMTINFLSAWQSNLFYRTKRIYFLIAIVGLIASTEASAINISAVYFSACQRETGIIVHVDENVIQLLNLKGKIKMIHRFNIIYMANYPLGRISISQIENPEIAELVSIKTVFENKIVDLVEGWMIDFSEDQISFLTLSGTETIIDTVDIWDIEVKHPTEPIEFSNFSRKRLLFHHPYPFNHCKPDPNGESDPNPDIIYPQHLLGDPLLIKKELDRLKIGYDRLRGYHDDKVFYAVPQTYSNNTTLGLWSNIGSRYGASGNRQNNFIPEVKSELSEGPFGFQRVLVTGNSLMPYGIHEEPQMQFYYALKADYIHFGFMLDFNRFYIGEQKYKWQKTDLLTNDDRWNDSLIVSGGFDYGPFALDLTIWDRLEYAIKSKSNFHHDDMNLNKMGLKFQNRFFKAELFYGIGVDEKEEPMPLSSDESSPIQAYIKAYNDALASKPYFRTKIQLIRANFDFITFGDIQTIYSLIYRNVEFYREKDLLQQGEFHYSSQSITNSIYLDYNLDEDLKISGYASLELFSNEFGEIGLDDNDSASFVKAGFRLALFF